MKVSLIDICSGIGGFALGLKQAGFEFDKEYYSEIDKNAEKIYKRHFPKSIGVGDITAVDPTRFVSRNDNDFFITGGFPCQSFSIAGERSGFEDTRGTIFFDIARIAKYVRPKYMLLENVKGLLNHDEGRTFKTIIRTLDELRIFETIEWFVFNSKNHGVAQNRERIFIFCSRKGSGQQVLLEREKIKRSIKGSTTAPVVRTITAGGHSGGLHSGMTLLATNFQGNTISNTIRSGGRGSLINKHNWDTVIIDDPSRKKGLVQKNIAPTLRAECHGNLPCVAIGTLRTHKDGNGFREMKDKLCPTIPARAREDGSGQPVITIPVLTPDRPEKRQNGRRFKTNNEPSFTITAQDKHGIYNGQKIRRLTPIECERLQGFPDGWTEYDYRLQNKIKDSPRYKALGNAVTVNVVEYIGRNILESVALNGANMTELENMELVIILVSLENQIEQLKKNNSTISTDKIEEVYNKVYSIKKRKY